MLWSFQHFVDTWQLGAWQEHKIFIFFCVVKCHLSVVDKGFFEHMQKFVAYVLSV